MTLDIQDLSLWVQIAAEIVTTAGVIGGWMFFIGRSIRADFADLRLAVQTADARAKLVEESLRRSIEESRLYAAEHYTTKDALTTALDEVKDGLNRLADLINQILMAQNRGPSSK